MNKGNPVLALIAPFPLIFHLNLLIAFEAKLLTNPGKVSPAKGIETSFSAALLTLANQEPKDLPD